MPRPIGGYSLAESAENARRRDRENLCYVLGTIIPLAGIILFTILSIIL